VCIPECCGVEKKVLGRGLGDLLGEKGEMPGRSPIPRTSSTDSTALGAGLGGLIRPRNGVPGVYVGQGQSRAQGSSSSGLWVVTSSLLTADILLSWLTSHWFIQRVPSALDCSILVLALGFAAWLGLLAVWLHFQHD
jgi:hypothetical protein